MTSQRGLLAYITSFWTLDLFHCSPWTARLLCAPFQIFPPLATLLTVLHLTHYIKLPSLVFAYLAFETIFYAGYMYKAYTSQARVLNVSRDRAEILKLFNRALMFGLPPEMETKPIPHDLDSSSERVTTFRKGFSAWFFNVPFVELESEDVLNWLAWSLLDSELPASGDDRKTCEECMQLVQKRAAWKFKQGKSNRPCIRLTIDPVRVAARPFFLYLSVGAWNKGWEWILLARGFKKITSRDDAKIEALLHVPNGWQEHQTKLPLLFLHGLGLGFAQYRSLIQTLARPGALPKGDRPILILIQPNISMTLGHRYHLRPPSRVAVQQGLLDIIDQLGWEEKGIEVLSHSFGTIVHGQLLKSKPNLVKRSCFVDPVCFCLWEPNVCAVLNKHGQSLTNQMLDQIPNNFLYKVPESGIETLMRYFVARELGIALSIQRHFDWADNLLWHHQIPNVSDPNKTSFFLAGQDGVAYTPQIRTYLLERGVSEESGGLYLEPEAAHGESLITGGKTLKKIMLWLTEA